MTGSWSNLIVLSFNSDLAHDIGVNYSATAVNLASAMEKRKIVYFLGIYEI